MRKILLSLISLFLSLFAWAQLNHRVVGYLPSYRFGSINAIEIEKVTHVNLSFANPDVNGNLIYDAYQGNGEFGLGKNFSSIVENVHGRGAKVLISVAGGALWGDQVMKERYDSLMTTAQDNFIGKIVDYIDQHDLDGIDIDIEGDLITSNLAPFLVVLADTCHKRGWEATAAWPGVSQYSDRIGAEGLAALDYINIMSYDATGPWGSEGQHAPYADALDDINYWLNRNVPAANLNLGLPFYGYDFSTNPVTAKTFGQIVAMNSEYADEDTVGQLYYNGRPTIVKKTQLAMDMELGGVMIWELGQDSFDDHSLLSAIYEKMTTLGTAAPVEVQNAVDIYPIPASDVLSVNSTKAKISTYELLSSNGSVVKSAIMKEQIEVGNVKPGTYILKLSSDRGDISKLVIIE